MPDEEEFMSNTVNLKEISASEYVVPHEAQSRYSFMIPLLTGSGYFLTISKLLEICFGHFYMHKCGLIK